MSLILCDETPRRAGSHETSVLSGVLYTLTFEAVAMQNQAWTGSEYYERVVDHYWWEGEGKVYDGGQPEPASIFLFKAPLQHQEDGRDWRITPLAESLLNFTSRRSGQATLLPGMETRVVDLICAEILRDCSEQRGRIPRITLCKPTAEQLVSMSLAYDPEGQAHLSL